ncbi:MAG TPA: alpha/beta hydrolase [Acidobacteriaceae bacterium]|nr:alpha/beta hydrolase [Acidobacteriaceae bacterium]
MKKSRLIAGAVFLAATLASAQAGQTIDPALEISTLQLWPSGAPQTAGTVPADLPTLTVFLPQKGRGTGSAVIVAPGGAYLGLASNLEGRQVADWFTARGVTAFVLKYRLGAKYLYPIPLLDAQRAVRLVRSLAASYGFSPDRIGFVGFSAGGHLAATTGTLFDTGKPDASDPVERLSDRPDFLVLGYPWLNAMQPSGQYITYCSVIKTIPPATCKEDEQKYTPSLHVTSQTPTTFIYSTTDDRTVPISASVDFYRALVAAGVPAELHIFRNGEHGSGLGAGKATLDQWPVLLEAWLRDQGFLTPIK